MYLQRGNHCNILLHKGTEQQQDKTKAYPYHTQQSPLKAEFLI